MKYLTLSLLLVLSLACGKLPEVPDAGSRNPETVPIVIEDTRAALCDVAQDALYCADGGVPMGRVAGVPNVASIGLFARFTPDPSFFNVYGRLVEMGGDGGGAALSISGAGGGINVDCHWWGTNAFGNIVKISMGSPTGAVDSGPHTAYCEVDATGARLYVDGVLMREKSGAQEAFYYHPTTANIGVGTTSAVSTDFDLHGTIEEVALFSSLTLEEIALISE